MNLIDILSSAEFVSGQEIARRMQISRAAVHKKIEKLRKLGYVIDGEPRRGYVLVSRPDVLVADDIQRRLGASTVFGRRLHVYPSIHSTQAVAREMAEAGAPEGTVVAAETQSGGYGRLRREWSSPRGGLWFSLIMRPEITPERMPQITILSCVAVCRAMERSFGVEPLIKWPNDVMLGGKKNAGILTEMSAEPGKVNWVVLGIGMNVNNAVDPGLSAGAVSLASVTGAPVDRPLLLARLLDELDACCRGLRSEGFARFSEEYNRRSLLGGREVTILSGDRPVSGIVDRIDEDGFLWLRHKDGTAERIIAGTVTAGRGDKI